MILRRALFTAVIIAALMSGIAPLQAEEGSLAPLLNQLKQVGPEGEGNAEAAKAWNELTQSDSNAVIPVLEAMDGAGPLTRNWLRSAAETLFAKGGSEVDSGALLEFLQNEEHDSKARDLAYDFYAELESEKALALIPSLLNDPSPSLRRLSVAQLIENGKAQLKEEQKDASLATLTEALTASRDVEQINTIAKLLREDLEQKVDLPKHFGFLSYWHVIAPFDNTGRKGFNTVFPPEEEIDLDATYNGKDDKEVKWEAYQTSDDYGMADFNTPFGPLKEVVGYAYTEYTSDEEREAELRLGCKNAWKIWFNGELVFGRDEYHRGISIDQYVLPVTLKKGKNTLLVKACQNEQEESWTVQWQFQLRVCDSTGTAILAADRKPTPEPEVQERRRGKGSEE